LATPE